MMRFEPADLCCQKRSTVTCVTSYERSYNAQVCKRVKTGLFLVLFRPFLNILTNNVQNLMINGRSRDGVFRIRTRDLRIVGTDESTGLWLFPNTAQL